MLMIPSERMRGELAESAFKMSVILSTSLFCGPPYFSLHPTVAKGP